MKIRTLEELEESLTRDIKWRKRELTTLKFMVKDNKPLHKKNILRRAAIALLYSHWEGHIKHCSLAYLNYLNSLGLQCNKIADNFIQLNLCSKFDTSFSVKSTKNQKDIHDYFSNLSNFKFKVVANKTIDTKSNLNSEVLLNILSQLGLSNDSFELKSIFIDTILLKNRNSISHGEELNANDLSDAYNQIEDELLEMIQTFHNLVITAASDKHYLKV